MASAVERASSVAAKNICFRCKKEGHWAKDCPTRESGNGATSQAEAAAGAAAANDDNDNRDDNHFNLKGPKAGGESPSHADQLSLEKSKDSKSSRKRKRPHVSDMMLMGMDPAVSVDSGLEFVCKNANLIIPKLKSHRHSGKELSDLRQLLSFYREWNHTLAPAIPFAEFVRKVEKAGASRRMRVFLSELRRAKVHSLTKTDKEEEKDNDRKADTVFDSALNGARDRNENDDNWSD